MIIREKTEFTVRDLYQALAGIDPEMPILEVLPDSEVVGITKYLFVVTEAGLVIDPFPMDCLEKGEYYLLGEE